MRVLVTGGTGVLGTSVVRHLQSRDVTVRILTRGPQPSHTGLEWMQGDLTTGAGLDAALSGVDVIIHAATSPLHPQQDLVGTQHLLRHARQAGAIHVLYVSIVGIDAPGAYEYYTAKLAIEQEIAASGLPYSLQRATQFHEFVAYLLSLLSRGPLLLLPKDVTLQPVDADTIGARLADAALRPPAGRLPDLAGPELQSLERLARAWLRATGQRKWTLSVPLPVPMFRAMRGGRVTSSSAQPVGPTWADWLARQATRPNRYGTVR